MTRRGLIAIGLAVIVALLPSAVRADSEVADPAAIFPIVPDATGVWVHGPLSIYWDVLFDDPNDPGCGIAFTNMFFVLRLRKGVGEPAGFAGELRGICYEEAEAAIAGVQSFITTNVIPWFFPNNPDAQWALKAVRRIVQDGQTQFAPPFFMLLNVDLRVKRR
jgi:hypothetical protein